MFVEGVLCLVVNAAREDVSLISSVCYLPYLFLTTLLTLRCDTQGLSDSHLAAFRLYLVYELLLYFQFVAYLTGAGNSGSFLFRIDLFFYK